jgi:hypothetical protein
MCSTNHRHLRSWLSHLVFRLIQSQMSKTLQKNKDVHFPDVYIFSFFSYSDGGKSTNGTIRRLYQSSLFAALSCPDWFFRFTRSQTEGGPSQQYSGNWMTYCANDYGQIIIMTILLFAVLPICYCHRHHDQWDTVIVDFGSLLSWPCTSLNKLRITIAHAQQVNTWSFFAVSSAST